MCGPSSQEKATAAAQADFYTQLTKSYQQTYAQFGNIANTLTSTFTPILEAGPGQEGFSAAEKTALNSSATEDNATAYAASAKALAEQTATRGGGNAFLPSGVDTQLDAENTNAAAAQLAGAKNQIVQQDYQQGYQNWQLAANELGSTAGLLNPNATAGAATGAGSAASETENNMVNQQSSLWQAGIGALGGIAGGLAGGVGTGLGKRIGG